MRLRVFRTASEAAGAVAHRVADHVTARPTAVLGLPTGRTSIAIYDELVRLQAAGQVDFARVHTFNLDEFISRPSRDRPSFRTFMDRHLFERVNLPADHAHVLDGTAADLDAECERFEREIAAAGGIDLQILGIGSNGHIGFNEPAKALSARTHRARLTRQTRRANAGLFGGRLTNVPREALSMGMATILGARAIVLVATGRSKSRAVQAMLAERITTSVPASFLQLHRDVQIILDMAAAARLTQVAENAT